MKPKCLETRRRPNGLVFRRYRLPDGRTTTTIEMPETVFKAIVAAKRLETLLATFARGEVIRTRTAKIARLLYEGWKPTAIASEVGVTEEAVRMHRQRRKKR